MFFRRLATSGILMLLLVGYGLTHPLYGHPGFARQYKMSCATCHNPAPRLTAVGKEFARNAFTLKGEEPSDAQLDTGDPLLLLQALPPIGFRLDAYVRYRPDAAGTGMTGDFQSPYLMKFLSGGRLANKAGYYFSFFLSDQGELSGIRDAYLYFANILGTSIGMTLGQFQVSAPLFQRELRLTFEDYTLYNTRITPGVPVNLTYDRGVMLNYTAPWGSDVFLEVLNGNGIGKAAGGVFDGDRFKNLALRWSQPLSNLRLGAFGYYGKTGLGDSASNLTVIYGPDATLEIGPVEFNLQYLRRTDDNPYPAAGRPASEILTQGSLAEAIFTPHGDRSRWYLIGLFNYRTSNIREYFTGAPLQEYQSAGVTWTYLLARNLRLSLEYNRDLYNNQNRLTAGFFSAF